MATGDLELDLTGGRDAGSDFVIAEPPSDPARLEGLNAWIWDDAGRIALPRIAVDARGATWTTERMVSVNIALPDGRVYAVRSNEPPLRPEGDDGLARVIGGGPMRFECVEPYRHWRMQFDGKATATTAVAQLTQSVDQDAAPVDLVIDIDARMAAPPWTQGTLDVQGRTVAGEDRFEQLFTAEGRVRIDGAEIPFAGGGLRIHRKGGNRSDMSDWRGHCWQSARFPSGRAFGYIHHAPRPDGSVRYCEGFVLDGGEMLPARVVTTPWMTEMAPSGQDATLVLESSLGRVEVEAETVMSTFAMGGPLSGLQQGIARYRWDGEEAYGMIERSWPNATVRA